MIEDLKNELVSYERYENDQLFFIDQKGKDHSVKYNFSFSEWLYEKNNFPTIKVEGLEDNQYILSKFKNIKNINSIHLFVKNKKGFSFDWHEDDTNVYLYVLKGKKEVMFTDTTNYVGVNDGIYITKGKKHKVKSEENTWALSIGYDNE